MQVPRRPTKWSEVPFWLKVALVIFALDFVSFYIGSFILGGDATTSYYKEGKYYVTANGHSTEISRGQYYYTHIHLVSVAVVFLGIGIGLKKTSTRRPPQNQA